MGPLRAWMTALVVAALEMTPDCAVEPLEHDAIAWRTDADDARREAMATGRAVLVLASADWDMASEQMSRVSLRDPRVAAIVARDFIPLRVDMTDDEQPRARELLMRFRIVGTPTLQAWTPDLQHQLGAIYEVTPARCLTRALAMWREANARRAEGDADIAWARSPLRACDLGPHRGG